jgi:hypothetical protein
MPRKRPVKKGSFGGHFDELVKHFPNDRPAKAEAQPDLKTDLRNVHDRLFESARRQARDARNLATRLS